MKASNWIYFPLALSLLLVVVGAMVYYVHRYGGIPDNIWRISKRGRESFD